ncbi:UNVERIFIED_ORG: PII-like signaling protein [Martelella mediterranea]
MTTLNETEGEILTFWTQQDRMHGHQPLGQWLFGEIERHGIEGATLSGGLIGRGHDGMTHAMTLMDVAGQPLQITVIASTEKIDRLLTALSGRNLALFYSRTPARFATL